MRIQAALLLILLPVLLFGKPINFTVHPGGQYYLAYDKDKGYNLNHKSGADIVLDSGYHFNVAYLSIENKGEPFDLEFESNISPVSSNNTDVPGQLSVFNNIEDAVYAYRAHQNTAEVKRKLSDSKNSNLTSWWADYPTIRFHIKDRGVGKISCREIINANPEFDGISANQLKLVNLGESKAFYRKSSSSTLSASDTIFFFNDRVPGDTTYYHFYAPYNTYYLTTSPEFEQRTLRIDSKNGKIYNETVSLNLHLEENNIYTWGKNVLDAHTSEVEGLYKAEVSAFENYYANILTNAYYPFFVPNQVGNIKARIAYGILDSKDQPNTKISFVSNGSQIEYKIHSGFSSFTEEVEIANEKFINGLNSVGLRANAPSTEGADYLKFLDWVEIEARASAVAQEAYAYFDLEKGFYTKVDNFEHPTGIAINESESTIQFLQGIDKDLSVKLSARGDFFASAIGDIVFAREAEGFHLIGFDKPYGSYIYRYASNLNSIGMEFQNLNTRFKLLVINKESNSSTSPFNIAKVDPENISIYLLDNLSIIDKWENRTEIDINTEYSQLGLNYSFDVAGGEGTTHVVDSKRIKNVFGVEKVKDISDEGDSPVYLIITEKSLFDGATYYSEYRKETGYSTRIVLVQDIYDNFNHGIKDPLAIKDYFRYMVENWEIPPKYAFLVGDANLNSRLDDFEAGNIDDFVPTYGLPASDAYLSYVSGDDAISDIMVSRIPAHTNDDVIGYLSKVQRHENAPNVAEWHKNILNIYGYDQEYNNGGSNLYLDIFGSHVGSLIRSDYCFDSVMVVNGDDAAVSEGAGNIIRREINDGKFWTTYFGHASAQVFEIDGWQVDVLNNSGKYGFFSSMSCNTGAYSDPYVKWGRNEEYVIDSINGFIAATGSTSTGSTTGDPIPVANAFFRLRTSHQRTLGELFAASRNIKNTVGDFLFEAVKLNVNLLGDPAVKLPIDTLPNYLVLKESFRYENELGEKTIFEDNDSIYVSFEVFNNGPRQFPGTEISVVRTWNSLSDTINLPTSSTCGVVRYEFTVPVKAWSQDNVFTIIMDPEKKHDTYPLFESENIQNRSIYVFSRSLLPIEPFSSWNVDSERPVLRMIVPESLSSLSKEIEYKAVLRDLDSNIVAEAVTEQLEVGEGYITWRPNVKLTEGKEYEFSASYFDMNGTQSDPAIIRVFADIIDYSNTVSKKTLSSELDSYRRLFDLNQQYEGLTRKQDTVHFSIYSNIGLEGFPGLGLEFRDSVQGESWRFLMGTLAEGFVFQVYDKDSLNQRPKEYYFNTFVGDPVELADFLKDTITENHIVLGGVGKNYWRAFYEANPSSPGYIDSLPKYFEDLGIQFPDSIVFTCWGFMGSKDPLLKSQAVSEIGYFEPVTATGKFVLKRPSSVVSTDWTIAAKDWESIQIIGEQLDAIDSIRLKGRLAGLNSFDTLLVPPISNIDLSTMPIDNMDIALDIYWTNSYHEMTIIEDIIYTFSTKPEYQISKGRTAFRDTILRGEDLYLDVAWDNLSIRNKDDIGYDALIIGESYQEFATTPYDSSFTFISDDLPERPIASFEKQDSLIDLYGFNNSYTTNGYIGADTVIPVVYLEMDGEEAYDQMFVSLTPKVKIELYDNSPLEIKDASQVDILVNGQTYSIPENAFTSFGRDVPIKASIEFELGEMNLGNQNANYIIINFRDRAGNRSAEIDLYFNVASSHVIENLNLYPNPSAVVSTFSFNHVSPFESTDMNLSIYDLNGKNVYKKTNTIKNGRNELVWEGVDNEGIPVSSGIYFYVLNLDSELYFEPISGKLIRIE